MEEKKNENKSQHTGDGIAARDEQYKETYRATRDHKAAVRSYCQGNVWATENAKAVGNWR